MSLRVSISAKVMEIGVTMSFVFVSEATSSMRFNGPPCQVVAISDRNDYDFCRRWTRNRSHAAALYEKHCSC